MSLDFASNVTQLEKKVKSLEANRREHQEYQESGSVSDQLEELRHAQSEMEFRMRHDTARGGDPPLASAQQGIHRLQGEMRAAGGTSGLLPANRATPSRIAHNEERRVERGREALAEDPRASAALAMAEQVREAAQERTRFSQRPGQRPGFRRVDAGSTRASMRREEETLGSVLAAARVRARTSEAGGGGNPWEGEGSHGRGEGVGRAHVFGSVEGDGGGGLPEGGPSRVGRPAATAMKGSTQKKSLSQTKSATTPGRGGGSAKRRPKAAGNQGGNQGGGGLGLGVAGASVRFG